jgi:hypothetical protein
MFGELEVVETRDSDVFGDAQTERTGGLQHAEREKVVGADDGLRPVPSAQELRARVDSAAGGEVAQTTQACSTRIPANWAWRRKPSRRSRVEELVSWFAVGQEQLNIFAACDTGQP